MITIKLKFRPSTIPHAEGTLYYQLIHNRHTKWIRTPHHLLQKEWDSQTASLLIPPSGERREYLLQMQSTLAWELKQRTDYLSTIQATHPQPSLETLSQVFQTFAPYQTVFTFLQQQISKKEQMKRQGTARNYASAYRRFKEFRENKDLVFSQLTPDIIESYEAWLINRRLQPNSIRFYLRTLNTLLYKAIPQGYLTHSNLFSSVRLSYVSTTKRAISEKALKAIAQLQLPESHILSFARDIFMFSFYMRGMPFVDIAYLRKSDLRNGMLSYCRKKTNQYLTIAWEKAQQEVVDRYAHQTQNSPYLFPIILHEDGTEYRQYQRMQENVNRALKKIGEMIGLQMPLTTYVARHTWASIARDMNISIAIISQGMGHTSLKTTQVYLNSIDTSRINEANKMIIQKISGVKY